MTDPPDSRTITTLWRLALGVAVAYALVLLLPMPLFDPDEGLHAAMAREMVERGDWVTPRLLGVPFLDKPVLYFWALAASVAAFGANEFAIRLPGIGFGLLGAVATATLGSQLAGKRAGRIGGLVHATMVLPLAVSAVAVHDIALVPFTTLTMLGLWRASRAARIRGAVSWGVVAGLTLGAAILTKALSGVAAVGLPFAVWMLWDRRVRAPLLAAGIACVVVGALVALPWYLAMERANAGYLHYYFVERHLLGYTTSTQLHGHRSWWYYLPILAGGALPWTGFLWIAARDLWRRAMPAADLSAQRLLWTWLVVGAIFFSSAGSKLVTYVLPLFPAIALLVATMWDRRWLDEGVADRALRSADSLGGVSVSLLLPALLGLSMRLFGLTPESLFGTFLVVAGLALAILWARGSDTRARDRFTRLAGAFAIVAPLVVLVVMAPAAPVFSARALARHYNAQRAVPPAVWFFEERVGSFLFYLDRDLRATLTPGSVENVGMDRLFRLRQSPPGLAIAIPAEAVATLERRITLGGVPHIVAGHHRVYDGAAFAEAVRRSTR